MTNERKERKFIIDEIAKLAKTTGLLQLALAAAAGNAACMHESEDTEDILVATMLYAASSSMDHRLQKSARKQSKRDGFDNTLTRMMIWYGKEVKALVYPQIKCMNEEDRKVILDHIKAGRETAKRFLTSIITAAQAC